jgi:ATP-binding cassette, subfamily B, bacterial
MKGKFRLFRESLKLVWQSAPGWALSNILVSVFCSILPLVILILIKEVIDGITSAASPSAEIQSTSLLWLIPAVVIIWLFDEAFSDLGNFIKKKQSLKLEAFMYGKLHEKAIRLDLINFERPEYFDCLSRAAREAPWRPNSILNNIIALLKSFFSLLLMAGLITTLHWILPVILIVANIPGIWLRLHYSNILYNFQKKQTPEARKSAYFNWLLTGDRASRELRLFGLGDYFIGLFRKSFFKQKEEELEIVKKKTITEIISDIFKALAFLAILMFIARQTIVGKITIGQMAMFLLAFRQGMLLIKETLSSLAGLYEDGLFIGDTFEFLNLEEKIKTYEPVNIVADLNKSIKVENLSFTYPGNNVATIDNISFEIKKGETVAIVGPNGAGKSTLVRLLCRLYEADSGKIFFDNNNIKNIDPDNYKKLFSVVFQDFMLYNISAGENIRMGNIGKELTDERLVSSATDAGVHELISNLPRGYDTVIGTLFDDSRELSWGEWQKIALARALFRDSPILILDEPSSAMDSDTEYDIFNRFSEIVKGRTSILISHRFTNICIADRIIVLNKGRISETGTHDELIQKRGIYYEMFTKQSNRFKQ